MDGRLCQARTPSLPQDLPDPPSPASSRGTSLPSARSGDAGHQDQLLLWPQPPPVFNPDARHGPPRAAAPWSRPCQQPARPRGRPLFSPAQELAATTIASLLLTSRGPLCCFVLDGKTGKVDYRDTKYHDTEDPNSIKNQYSVTLGRAKFR
ncbi:hypothetical protein TRIUR3_29814 [Triticum urartu]|uniref:Uncharacterized protein n=1 Tax=Triticum urartu TaxID=4572 RepID=M7ZNU5_TRIUA|nr:hypothetical protein TRIUR3_29814 [Triticum urartu]